MSEIVQYFILILVGVLLIGKGSDWFTDALIPIARRMGTSAASVGLILVSVAVSLPEVFVAVDGVLREHSSFSLGVTLGSIACNIALMTGLCALIQPLKVTNRIILRDGIFSITVPILVFAVAAGGQITRLEGMAFLCLFIPYVINVFLQEQQDLNRDQLLRDIEIELDLLGFSFAKIRSPWVAFVLGLSLLLWGTQIFTVNAIGLARALRMDELFIGMTIGAIGPSIPNIVSAYQATRKGMHEVAISGTLGSNIFTLLVTLGVLSIFKPIIIAPRTLFVDLGMVLLMSLLLFIVMVTRKMVSRVEGTVLICCYLVFLVLRTFLQ